MKKKKLLVGKMKRFKTFFVILVIVIFSGQMAVAQDYNLSIWDFSDTYETNPDNNTLLTVTLAQDAKGKVTGSGTFERVIDGDNMTIKVDVKGKVKGKKSIVTLKYRVKGKDAEGNKILDILKLKLVEDNKTALVGSEKGKICVKGEKCVKIEDESATLPVGPGMTGKAFLEIVSELDAKGKKLEGTAKLTLSNGDIYDLYVKGKINSKKGERKYQLKGDNETTKGIKIKLKIDNEADNATKINGKALGQQLKYKLK